MTAKIVSLERIKQTHIEALEDRLRSNANKLTDAMNTIVEQEIALQMMDQMLSQVMEQTYTIIDEMKKENDDYRRLIYALENDLEEIEG